MKLKKRQYRELISILKMHAEVIEEYCLEHEVAQEIPYIKQDIQRALNYIGSAHDTLVLLITEVEGKRDE